MKRLPVLWLAILLLTVAAGCSLNVSAEFKAEEALAMEYVEKYVNEADSAKKRAFLEAHVDAEVRSIFELNLSVGGLLGQKEHRFDKAKVAGSKSYRLDDGSQGVIVLLRGQISGKAAEQIVLIREARIAWVYTDQEEEASIFTEMRAQFK